MTVTQFAPTTTTLQKIFPVFLVVDTSYSMEGAPLAAASTLAPTLIDACLEEPSVTDIARVELIEFNSTARVVIPSAKASQVRSIPTLESDGGTDFGSAFTLLRERIEEVCTELKTDGYRVLRPAVFFITDGEPIDTARSRDAAFAALTDESFPYSPNICMFGVGAANGATLEQYISRKGRAFVVPGDAAAALRGIVTAITSSVVASAVSGPATSTDNDPFVLDMDAIDEIDDVFVYGN